MLKETVCNISNQNSRGKEEGREGETIYKERIFQDWWKTWIQRCREAQGALTRKAVRSIPSTQQQEQPATCLPWGLAQPTAQPRSQEAKEELGLSFNFPCVTLGPSRHFCLLPVWDGTGLLVWKVKGLMHSWCCLCSACLAKPPVFKDFQVLALPSLSCSPGLLNCNLSCGSCTCDTPTDSSG